jgi:nicotinate-nucleotide adenylyltransferase
LRSIALFGGSFDPFHEGHKAVIFKAFEKLNIDKLIIIPAYLNPFKRGSYFSPQIRLKKIFDFTKKYENIEVSDFEISKKEYSYTIDTIKHIKNLEKVDRIYLLIGEDNLARLDEWKEIEQIKAISEIVVATRKDSQKIEHNFLTLDVSVDISSTKIRQMLEEGKYLEKRIENIKAVLDNKKAENIEVFDVKDKGYLVDYVVIATTLNGKHGFALLDYLKEDLKPNGEEFLRVDEDDDWIVIDLGDIFIHLMSPKYREKYCLEDFLKEIAKTK